VRYKILNGILLALAIASSATAAADNDLVRLSDGRRLFLHCTGQGAPTVILEGGFAATSGAWFKVQPVVAQKTRVCSSDRAGYGQSDPGPFPRDGLAVARDLNQALIRAGISGPYVLVGHSVGALYMRIFADLRPDDVVGMVLVDPSIEYQDKRFASQFGPGAGSVAPLRQRAQRCLDAINAGAFPSTDPALKSCAQDLRADVWHTQISELDTMWSATSDAVARGRRSYGDMPLIVLTADRTYGTSPAGVVVGAFWSQLHREMAQRSTRGREEAVSNSSHMMMFDRPDAIESAIDEVVTAARAHH
jgi:pimeloyl-ACP methyl ester carboxylesterase